MKLASCLRAYLGLLSFLTTVSSAPTLNDLVVLEKLQKTPQGWHSKGVPRPDQVLRLRIAVKQDRAYEFEQHVLAISDPDHPKYGQHMKRDELKSMLRPSTDASSAIKRWLRAEGIPITLIQDDGQWINFYTSTTEAERILGAKFRLYRNEAAGLERIRTLQYSLPAALHRYVHMIQPTTRFGQYRPERSTIFEEFEVLPANTAKTAFSRYTGPGLDADFCNSTITPQCLRDLYEIGDARGSDSNGRCLGLTVISLLIGRSRQPHRCCWLSKRDCPVQ